MTSNEFNTQFNKIVGNDQSIQFAIGNDNGEPYVAIFYGELTDDLDDLDTIFIQKGGDNYQNRKDGIKFLKQNY